jgi:hypothetical protein
VPTPTRRPGTATHLRRRLSAVSPNLYATACGLAGLAGAAKLIDQPKAGAMFLGFVMLVMITVLIGGIALWSLVALRQGVFLPAGPA